MSTAHGHPGFEFPPLGPTGVGDPPYPGKRGEVCWQGRIYGVSHQADRPAVAFRCHYPGGSAPCDEATAERFIEWAKSQEKP